MWVKVSPPLHIRVVQHPSAGARPSFFALEQYAPERNRPTASEVIERFMSSWTSLVGDPILSKWIVVLLAISISLNGFLLKGLALGLPSVSLVMSRIAKDKGGVRFEEKPAHDPPSDLPSISFSPSPPSDPLPLPPRAPSPPSPLLLSPPSSAPVPLPVHVPKPTKPVDLPMFILEDVGRRLVEAAALDTPPLTDSRAPTPPPYSSSSTLSIRSLNECINVFENGPRPLSLSLKTLNDEEVILLAQNGKIAMYALEKILGNDELERAVRIRRALVCKSFSTDVFSYS